MADGRREPKESVLSTHIDIDKGDDDDWKHDALKSLRKYNPVGGALTTLSVSPAGGKVSLKGEHGVWW